MKKFISSLKRSDGFTLVELMVVVAIIGLLSAVAVPNFKRYQAKSKISEAKLQLSALYTAEQAFFSDYNIYHNCLPYMGYDPGPETPSRYYAIGFNTAASTNTNAFTAATNSGLNATDCPRTNAVSQGSVTAGVNSAPQSTWFAAGKGVGGTIATANTYIDGTALGDQSSTGNMSFTASAGGVISGDFMTESTASNLTINEDKLIQTPRNGF